VNSESADVTWTEYFSGGVPTGEYFRTTLADIEEVCLSAKDDKSIHRLNELCFIGLVSYFEAFCKDHFASILNIMPELLDDLKANKQDISIDSSRVVAYGGEITHKLGFLVAEKYDFGTAQKINTIYKALINITPFSKSDIRIYSEILRDRNLLVHHGGTYTLSYIQQASIGDDGGRNRAFLDSLMITKESVIDKLHFLGDLARKMLKASNSAALTYMNEHAIVLGAERRRAIDAFLWWGN
jgi:hypothetical protein